MFYVGPYWLPLALGFICATDGPTNRRTKGRIWKQNLFFQNTKKISLVSKPYRFKTWAVSQSVSLQTRAQGNRPPTLPYTEKNVNLLSQYTNGRPKASNGQRFPSPVLNVFVSTKFHFDETISLAGLVSFIRPTFMGTLRLCNFCNFGATLLGFGSVFSNIIVHGIWNFGKNRITLT